METKAGSDIQISSWAGIEFGKGFSGFHGRNSSTLARAAERIASNSSASFSAALGPSLRQSVAAIFSKNQEPTEQMLSGHYHATIQRCINTPSTKGLIIAAQDSTYYNLSGHKQMEGLGTIQGSVKGIVQHNVLAMDQSGLPLGLLYSYSWTRGGQGHLDRENSKWTLGLQAVEEVVKQLQQQQGAEKKILLIQDREADDYSFLGAGHSSSVELLLRVHQRRNYRLQDGRTLPLSDTCRELKAAATMEVSIYRKGKGSNPDP